VTNIRLDLEILVEFGQLAAGQITQSLTYSPKKTTNKQTNKKAGTMCTRKLGEYGVEK
jgi:hypothetical protein